MGTLIVGRTVSSPQKNLMNAPLCPSYFMTASQCDYIWLTYLYFPLHSCQQLALHPLITVLPISPWHAFSQHLCYALLWLCCLLAPEVRPLYARRDWPSTHAQKRKSSIWDSSVPKNKTGCYPDLRTAHVISINEVIFIIMLLLS